MTTPTKATTKPTLLHWSAHVPCSDVQDPLGLSLRGSARQRPPGRGNVDRRTVLAWSGRSLRAMGVTDERLGNLPYGTTLDGADCPPG
jgi:hypothetical protein